MSESFRHLWGRTDKATPPTPDPREPEVKPCPWCGSTMPPTQRETDGAKWGALTCAECSAIAPEVRTGYGPPETWYADALAAWNERRAPAPSEAVVCERALLGVERCAVACEGCRVAYRECIIPATPDAAGGR